MTGNRGSSFHVGPDDNPDKYRLLRQVGGGGEAQLWQAELSVAGGAEPVAVKVLRPEPVDDFARLSRRWNEQAELLRFLRHPGVVGVREYFEGAPFHLADTAAETAGRSLYLVMNWVEGQPLRDWVMNNRDAPDCGTRIFRHLEQVAEVLDWLHSGQATPSNRPVVHGDLSPGNLMITPVGQVALVGFGLIQLTHHTQEAAGTPGYAAPEVWLSGQYSPASDRYSFGAIAYFALTGTVPPPNPEAIWAGLAATSLLAPAPLAKLDQLMEMFSADPAARPRATEWVRLLRNTATTNQHALSPPGPQPVPEQPSPTQPIVPPRPRRRIGRLAAAVAGILVAGVVLGVMATRSLTGERAVPSGAQPSRAEPTPASPVTTTPVTSTAPATTSSGAPPTVTTIVPAAVTVRRQSGDRPLRLTANYYADLDSLAPDWEVANRGVDGADLYLDSSGSTLYSKNGADFAPVSGPPDYTTCQKETAYFPGINVNDDRSGFSFCVRTSNRRFAFVTIVDPKMPVALDITIWDPPRR
ncbi:MAG: serine/threonine protein kinase [Pseudonocardiaceae bacterium]